MRADQAIQDVQKQIGPARAVIGAGEADLSQRGVHHDDAARCDAQRPKVVKQPLV